MRAVLIASICFLLTALTTGQPLTEADRRGFITAMSEHQNGRWAAAAESYRQVLETHPHFVPARIYLAEALWMSGEQEEARKELETSSEQAPGLLLPLLLLVSADGNQDALSALSDELPDTALRGRLQENINLEQQKFVPVGLPCLLLLSAGAVEESLEDYRKASALDPGEPELHRLMGSRLMEARRFLEASQAFETALQIEPNHGPSWHQLGSSYLVLLRWDSAAQAFEKALALGERDLGLVLALGYTYERQADFIKALEIYRQSERMAPSSPQPHYRVGRVLVELDELYDAEVAFRRALKLDPNMVPVISHLGAIHIKREDFATAVEELERAIELDPTYYEAYYHLSQAYWRTGRSDEARQALDTHNKLKLEYGGRVR
jgi:tetratricopeptide (TPR) repeat protein